MFGATISKVMNEPDNGEIVVWGDGTGTERDLLYISDVTDFIHCALRQESDFGLYNVGYGKSFSVKNIVEKIIKSSGKNLKITYDLSKPSINTKLALNSDKALRELGWKPKVSMEEGIDRTIKWYKENIEEKS